MGKAVVIYQRLNHGCSDREAAEGLNICNAHGYVLFLYYFSIISLSFLLLFSKCFCFIGRFQRQSHSIPEPSMLWLLSFPAFYRQHIRKTHIDRYTQIYTDIDTHHTHTGFLSSLRGLKTFAIGLRKLETKTKNSGSMTTMCSRIRMRSKLIYFNGFQLYVLEFHQGFPNCRFHPCLTF